MKTTFKKMTKNVIVKRVKAISIMQYQCENITFVDRSIYDRIFQQGMHKEGKSAITYIKIFQNYKALEIPVGNSYTEDHLMHTLLDNFQKVINTLIKYQATNHI